MCSLLISDDISAYIKNGVLKCYNEKEAKCRNGVTKLLEILSSPPSFTTVRLNTLKDVKAIKEELLKCVEQNYKNKGTSEFKVQQHPLMEDTVIISNIGPRQIAPIGSEVIVDLSCGMSVLRGSHVFVQGIIGAPHDMKEGDEVCVFADIKKGCLKGRVDKFDGPKVFVGNGVAKFSRSQIFQQPAILKGVGIEMANPLYISPSLNGLMDKWIFPQNLPSICCGHVLGAQPGDIVLDMCAAPGGKTTHIGCLMKNEGIVIALDKTKGKIEKLHAAIQTFGLTNVHAYQANSTNIVGDFKPDIKLPCAPPYPRDSFDRILLDAPCSALGQRPNLYNSITLSSVKSFPVLQRKLLEQAYQLLKPQGVVVYSTCTICTQENEEQVCWFLDKYPDMTLEKQIPHVGGLGLRVEGLTLSQCELLQRFLPMDTNESLDRTDFNQDTIGFFCAKFRKNCH